MKKETILWFVFGFLICLQIKSIFDKRGKTYEMGRMDEKIKYLEKERVEDSIVWVKREAAIDSLLALSVIRYEQLESKKQPLTIRYERIPTIVNDFDREQLRRAIADY